MQPVPRRRASTLQSKDALKSVEDALRVADGIRKSPLETAIETGFHSLIVYLVRNEIRLEVKNRALADAHRHEWAKVLAATVRVAGDLDVAQECAQDAYLSALQTWRRDGIPRNPGAWLTTTARRKALDSHRRAAMLLSSF